MATVGSTVVRLSATSTAFSADLGKAQAALVGFGNKANNVAIGIGTSFEKGFSRLAKIGGIGALIGNLPDFGQHIADSLLKVSDMLGVTQLDAVKKFKLLSNSVSESFVSAIASVRGAVTDIEGELGRMGKSASEVAVMRFDDDAFAKRKQLVDGLAKQYEAYKAGLAKQGKVPTRSLEQFTSDTLAQFDELTKTSRARVEMVAKEIEKRKELQAQMDRGKQIEESLRTPEEAFNTKVNDLMQLKDVGAISPETFNRGFAEAEAELEKALKLKEPPTNAQADRGPTGVATVGSQQEHSVLVGAQRAKDLKSSTGDPAKEMVRKQDIANRELAKISRGIVDMSTAGPTFEVVSLGD